MPRYKSSIVWRISKEYFTKLVNESNNFTELRKKFGFMNNGNLKAIKDRIKEEEIDVSHFYKDSNKKIRYTNEELFVENSNACNSTIKKRLIKDKLLPYKCTECGLTDTYNGKKVTLQLDHKNGINSDNRLENLNFQCGNCHSQTLTYAGKNKLTDDKIPKNISNNFIKGKYKKTCKHCHKN